MAKQAPPGKLRQLLDDDTMPLRLLTQEILGKASETDAAEGFRLLALLE